jgi:hypothetical protein
MFMADQENMPENQEVPYQVRRPGDWNPYSKEWIKGDADIYDAQEADAVERRRADSVYQLSPEVIEIGKVWIPKIREILGPKETKTEPEPSAITERPWRNQLQQAPTKTSFYDSHKHLEGTLRKIGEYRRESNFANMGLGKRGPKQKEKFLKRATKAGVEPKTYLATAQNRAANSMIEAERSLADYINVGKKVVGFATGKQVPNTSNSDMLKMERYWFGNAKNNARRNRFYKTLKSKSQTETDKKVA